MPPVARNDYIQSCLMFLGVRAGRKNTNPHCMAPNDIDRTHGQQQEKTDIYRARVHSYGIAVLP